MTPEGSYLRNPTAGTLDLNQSGGIERGSQFFNGDFMYVVTPRGELILGARAGARMPHPTLIGARTLVAAAGVVYIRGGRIVRVTSDSGHYQLGAESLDVAQDTFGRLPDRAFDPHFQGYVNHRGQVVHPQVRAQSPNRTSLDDAYIAMLTASRTSAQQRTPIGYGPADEQRSDHA